MPQLNKTNLVLTFVCTWMTLIFISKTMKKINMTSIQDTYTMKQNPLSWPWPYT
uniref:ATP synthase F0 subunit 8 n=1 Tax=Amerotyphlops reticulatus TaxID=534403 RepID=B3GT20_9SAUR|nr:ATP synthase F0 subunit 8 [Amerotyphlops reticulatus]ACD85890.1 ATP synthase F0 subunit 8 [Amerotyphlops reticulatus]